MDTPRKKTGISPSTTALNSKNEKETIAGLDVVTHNLCQCGSPLVRVRPHSIKSDIPIWRCVWCKRRRGKVHETHILLMESWLKHSGWTIYPLRFPDTGGVEIAHYC
jgi:hypothetical protein